MTSADRASAKAFFWDSYRDTTMGRYIGDREKAFIERCLGEAKPGLRLLEVACGSGRLTLPLHARGHRIMGLDIDPVALVAFRKRSDAVPLVLGDALRPPFASDSFDGLVAIQAFAQLGRGRFPTECRRLLRAWGLLIFEALNRHSYKGVLTSMARWAARTGRFRLMMRRSSRLRALENRFGRSEGGEPFPGESCEETLQSAAALGFSVVAISGFNWLPFRRLSNSRLVAPAAWLEKALRLDRHPASSPWVLLAAQKQTRPPDAA
jgi:SAM-dependent methyltransferase